MSSSRSREPELSRRQVLGAAAALTSGAALPMLSATPAQASVPDSPSFVLSGAGGNPIWRKPLPHQPKWAMQSFAYDNTNGHIYIAQHRIEAAPGQEGDIWLTKTDLSGNVLGSMALHGFGHGSSMGVQPTGVGSTPYIWIEGGDYDSNGAGEDLARFRYTNGITLDYFSPSIHIDKWTPQLTSYAKLPRPAIDPYTNRLLLRYATHEPATRVWRLAVFNLSDASAGRFGDAYRLAERALPNNDELDVGAADFQGITACGRYAYMSFGDTDGQAYLVKLDLNATGGSGAETVPTYAGDSLITREPEGVAIWMVSGRPRLAFGFSSRPARDIDNFEASIFYKSEFV